jgi:hypothetical protein
VRSPTRSRPDNVANSRTDYRLAVLNLMHWRARIYRRTDELPAYIPLNTTKFNQGHVHAPLSQLEIGGSGDCVLTGHCRRRSNFCYRALTATK